MYHYNQKTEDPLERAKKELESSQRQLAGAVSSADAKVQSLKQQRAQALRELKGAAWRHEQVVKVASCLCDACWSVAPALGINYNDVSVLRSGLLCLNCKVPMAPALDAQRVEMPPASTHSIDAATVAIAYSDEAVGPNAKNWSSFSYTFASRQHNAYSQTRFNQTWKANMDDSILRGSPYYHHAHTQTKLFPEKADFIRAAEKMKNQADNKVKQLQFAIPQWEEFRRQHEVSLQKVKSSLLSLEDRHRKVLQDKLDELGGSPSTNKCAICYERPKEIAFQCGHQSCTACSASISSCHTCRARILQRIRLY